MRKMSRRKVAVAGVVAMVILIIGLLVVPGLSASPATVVIDPAGSKCVIVNVNGTTTELDANKYKLISSNNDNDKITFQCEVWGLGNNGPAINLDSNDFLNADGDPVIDCEVNYKSGQIDIVGQTFDWHQTISAAGDLKLTCQFG